MNVAEIYSKSDIRIILEVLETELCNMAKDIERIKRIISSLKQGVTDEDC